MSNAAKKDSIDTINYALTQLEEFKECYPKEALDLLLQNQQEAIPCLIQVLEYLCEDTKRCIEEEPKWQKYLYSALLLGHFREPRAHQLLVRLFGSPGKYVDDLLGEVGTESLSALLYRTSSGSFDFIKQLALKQEVNEYFRGAAIEALALAVYDGQLGREEILEYFASLLKRKDLAEQYSFFWSSIGFNMCDLYPLGYLDVIEQAYMDCLIDPGHVGFEEFKSVLDKGEERALSKFTEILQRRDLNSDFHLNASWWACYNTEDKLWDTEPLDILISSKSDKNRDKRKESL